MPMIAVTGASGFIGRRLVVALADAGHQVRVLMRRDPIDPLWRDIVPDVVPGSLEDVDALRRLLDGADAVVHLAGLIKARSRAAFMAANHDGTARLAAAARDGAPDARFLHVSSMAARQPQLSDYAASKRAGEAAVRNALGTRALILRPAAVYGPGDPETLAFFRLALGKRVPLPSTPDARVAVIHVADFCSLILRLLDQPRWDGDAIPEAADGRHEGYGWTEILRTAAVAVGNPEVHLVQVPSPLLKSAAWFGDIARRVGKSDMLTTQKLRELRFPDWSVRAQDWACPPGWTPHFDLPEGFADAVRGYRALGWLPPEGS